MRWHLCRELADSTEKSAENAQREKNEQLHSSPPAEGTYSSDPLIIAKTATITTVAVVKKYLTLKLAVAS